MNQLTFTPADAGMWDQYGQLATRAYGHPISDITHLREHADLQVAVRGSRVVAGGLGILVDQFFGGRPVPGACLAGGCVAPEERGRHLATTMLAERIRPLCEQGAVLATVWTTSTGYAHRLGWAAPAQVFSWTVPTEELRRSFGDGGFDIVLGADADTARMQRELAAHWNGPWLRPSWWTAWQQDKHPGLVSYSFHLPGEQPAGLLSIAVDHDATGARQVVVHDFWAASGPAASAMLSFLGRYNSRIPSVAFQRTGLPSAPVLLEQLHRAGSASATHWHPWMLRVLDLRAAVRARGWPPHLDTSLTIEVAAADGTATETFTLRISAGSADLEATGRTGRCVLTRRQFAVWYAGGYRTAEAAHLAGVSGDPAAVADLVQTTSGTEPWMPDHF